MLSSTHVVVGAGGFLGSAIVDRLAAAGHDVTAVDRRIDDAAPARTMPLDLLVDDLELPPGDVFLVAGSSRPRVAHPWTLVLDNAITTARMMPHLADRRVILASTVEAGGRAASADRRAGLPISDDELREWARRAARIALEPCPPWRVAALCRELVDPAGRWTYGVAKRAQELLLELALLGESSPAPSSVRTVRLANLFGAGQHRVTARMADRARAGLPLQVTDTVRCFLSVQDAAGVITAEHGGDQYGGDQYGGDQYGGDQYDVDRTGAGMVSALGSPLSLLRVAELVQDTLGTSVAVRVTAPSKNDIDITALVEHADRRPDAIHAVETAIRDFVALPFTTAGGERIEVVIPPRSDRPDVLAARQQASLWSGQVKDGRWSTALTAALRTELGLDDDRDLVLCASGTAALRLAIVAGRPTRSVGDIAVLPSFTFPATAEALIQLGYRLRFVDVDEHTWTMDPVSLRRALLPGDAGVVVSVDTLGNPADYAALNAVCSAYGATLFADSAPALGTRYHGAPVAGQATAHAYSMSFAKVVSAGGTGGALVLPAEQTGSLRRPVDWLRSAQFGELSAATALEHVENLDELVARRAAVAAVYAEFAASRADVVAQAVRPGDRHSWVHWVARFIDVDRDRLQHDLAARGVASKPYYAPVLHRHDWHGAAESAPGLPITTALDREALALPMSSELTPEDAERVVGALVSALDAAQPRRAVCRDRPTHHVWPTRVHGQVAQPTTNPVAG